MRSQFQEELKSLNIKLLKMGSMVQNIIEVSVQSLAKQDLNRARSVFELDDDIDALELEIEHQCMNLIALQQPIARDLRTIGTILKIITDLERMGDHAVNIAKVTLEIGEDKLIKALIDIPKMARLTEDMVNKSLDAFMHEDIDLAKELDHYDDQVDDLYEAIYLELIEMMLENPDIIKQATQLLFIGRYLERTADHATNIGERIIYMVTGERMKIN
ncbi:phosphate signaling complex protein PhoU [Isachenkonia alkalipeptolytica]|uniref:Phosphate-specific transport system accessory protein PhoU n=1 Tax=Isachenkonia alkalipeptolytica TaxID=2565777 RepID=A0AA43XJE6_9CLOT|nr:phosphate signaling complex protein PhoU [Isachenkonia alkalipeptolytica]NBG87970.1 phosphate signaling complex protein PhoU [Isachenkonia alkalipeptolytica]